MFIDLINKLSKIDKMRGLSLFRNEFIKFNKTGARMLDSIDHMSQKLYPC